MLKNGLTVLSVALVCACSWNIATAESSQEALAEILNTQFFSRQNSIESMTSAPIEGFAARGPSSFTLEGAIAGQTPGRYTVASRATIKKLSLIHI